MKTSYSLSLNPKGGKLGGNIRLWRKLGVIQKYFSQLTVYFQPFSPTFAPAFLLIHNYWKVPQQSGCFLSFF